MSARNHGSRWKACSRKTAHRSKEAAESARSRIANRTGTDWHRLRVYSCGHCGGWHVGHLRVRKD